MKRFALLLLLCGIVPAPRAFAQDHVAFGAYADYFRLSQTDNNFAGVGARLGVGLGSLMLEGEMNYDFNQTFQPAGNSPRCYKRTAYRARRAVWQPLAGAASRHAKCSHGKCLPNPVRRYRIGALEAAR